MCNKVKKNLKKIYDDLIMLYPIQESAIAYEYKNDSICGKIINYHSCVIGISSELGVRMTRFFKDMS